MAFTYFFRDLHVLELTVTHVVPFIYGRSKIKIWDAGCAMGPEPYSLAILFAESMGQFQFRNLQIMASDHDEGGDFHRIIDQGVYPLDPLSRIPEELFKKYFVQTENPDLYQVAEKIRNSVRFYRHDLLSLEPIDRDFSLVICKNVLLHFQPEERVNVIRMFHDSLLPGGFFVTEQTQKMPHELAHMFEKKVSDGQLFQKAG